MRAIFILVVALLTARTAVAESRTILVELVPLSGSSPTVNVYSDVKEEQKTGVTIAEAALVLRGARHSGSMVGVYVLSESYVTTRDLTELLNGMQENYALRVVYVELGSRSEASKQLLERFKALPRTSS